MDIRNWPIDKIMQLPDCCFGRRFMITCALNAALGVQVWDISEIAIPEKAVIWELTVDYLGIFTLADRFRLAIGDQLPTTAAQMDALDPLIPGMGLQGPEPRQNQAHAYQGTTIRMLRMPIHVSGQRMILELTPEAESNKGMIVRIIISSFPTEVPEWLISGQGSYQ